MAKYYISAHFDNSFFHLMHDYQELNVFEPLELSEKALIRLLDSKDYEALSINAPYKRLAYQYCDVMSRNAQKIKAVDMIVMRDNARWGYNTDYAAIHYLFKYHHLDLVDKKVLIFGKGASGTAAGLVVSEFGGNPIFVSNSENSDAISYEECLIKHLDAKIAINACSVGNPPNIDFTPIDLKQFKALEWVIDFNANPIISRFILQAHYQNISYIIGLELLAVKCAIVSQLVLGHEFIDAGLDACLEKMLYNAGNIVLIGMPSSGKTTLGHLLALKLNKNFVDMDEMIVQDAQKSIAEIFADEGEGGFRKRESDSAKHAAGFTNTVIATGGGAVKNPQNMDYLSQNGIIIFIDRNLDKLIQKDASRPLLNKDGAIEKLYHERIGIYRECADMIIENNGDIMDTLDRILIAYREGIKQRFINIKEKKQ